MTATTEQLRLAADRVMVAFAEFRELLECANGLRQAQPSSLPEEPPQDPAERFSRMFFDGLKNAKIDYTNPKVKGRIGETLVKMGFHEDGKPSSKKFQNIRQVQAAITAVLETERIYREVRHD